MEFILLKFAMTEKIESINILHYSKIYIYNNVIV